MKFKEFLKEDHTEQDLGEWVMDYVTYLDATFTEDYIEKSPTYDFKHGEFWLLNKRGDAASTMTLNFSGNEFIAPPLGKYKWPKIARMEITKADIAKWTDVPPSTELQLDNCHLPAFKGITALKEIERLDLEGVDDLLFESKGLLGILKLPHLKEFIWTRSSHSKGFKPLHKALNIIQEHVDNGKNLVEAQSEMIDAGLEEYAKL